MQPATEFVRYAAQNDGIQLLLISQQATHRLKALYEFFKPWILCQKPGIGPLAIVAFRLKG